VIFVAVKIEKTKTAEEMAKEKRQRNGTLCSVHTT
jgi:hypothetical protein